MKHRFTLLHTYFLRILNDGLDCIADVAREWCGDAAANHRRKIEALVLTPIAESLFCVLEKRTLRLILTPWSSKLTFVSCSGSSFNRIELCLSFLLFAVCKQQF